MKDMSQIILEKKVEHLDRMIKDLEKRIEEIETGYHEKSLKNELLSRGLTKARLDQMLFSWNGDIEQVYTVVDNWGVERCNRGYDIFNFDGTGLLEIDKIDDVDCFDSVVDAVDAAVGDGVKIIPVDELPNPFIVYGDDRRYFGWVDTPENRKAIQDYCDKYCE